jgi:hypothetical protein
VAFWFARPAIVLLVVEGTGSHSHPPPEPARESTIPLADLRCRLPLFSRGHVVHPDPFWPQYRRMLAGWPWPGDYECPLVPTGTVAERPAWRGEMVSADEY